MNQIAIIGAILIGEMIPLHGVIGRQPAWTFDNLKRPALFIDQFRVMEFSDSSRPKGIRVDNAELAATLDFLEDKKIVVPITEFSGKQLVDVENPDIKYALDCVAKDFVISSSDEAIQFNPDTKNRIWTLWDDGYSRVISAQLRQRGNKHVVPLLQSSIMREGPEGTLGTTSTMEIAINFLPTPNEATPWQDIIDYRIEFNTRLWEFRRFIASLATSAKPQDEVRDEIEWRLNQYSEAIRKNKMKSSTSFMSTVVIPTAEAIENLAHFNWSKVAKGIIAVKERKNKLLDEERSAPGGECAYIFRANERFGS